ncbi:MAG: NmrA/HSCARG family protein [Acidobacteriota bacterium]|nr:MAG: NmrA/HSCARG family protein [Acidobacteriota bacterium]
MANRRLIAAIGATGAQGGGLARAILSDPEGGFAVRAVTRNPDSDAARILKEQGAEVVAADLDDVGSLRDAFRDAYGAFCVTNFWEHFSPEKEKAQAANLAEAAAAEDLSHVIWSTLEDTRRWVPLEDDRMPTLMDHYKVPHFDAKGESDARFTEAGVPTTFLLTSFYWDNLIGFGMEPKRTEDGSLAFYLPMGDARLPGIAAEDIGKCAYGILKEGADYAGETVGIAGAHPTGEEMAAALTDAFGEPVTYVAVPFDAFRAMDFPGAADLGNMFQFKADFNDYFLKSRDLELSKKLNPELMNFKQWLAVNRDRIPVD